MNFIFKDVLDFFKNPNSTGKLAFSIGFMSVILTIIFFTFGLYIEHKRYQEQIDVLVKSILDEFNYLIPNDLKKILSDLLSNNSKKTATTDSDKSIEKNNKKIRYQSIFFCLVLVIIACVINYFLYKNNPTEYDLGYILKNTIIMIIFLVITEIIFTLLIIRHFRIVNKDFVKIEMIRHILDKKWKCPF